MILEINSCHCETINPFTITFTKLLYSTGTKIVHIKAKI